MQDGGHYSTVDTPSDAVIVENCQHPIFCLILNIYIHPERVEPASPMEFKMSLFDTAKARRFSVSSLEIFTESFLHRTKPNTRGLDSCRFYENWS